MEILLDRVCVGSLVKALYGFSLSQRMYVYKTNWEVGDICLIVQKAFLLSLLTFMLFCSIFRQLPLLIFLVCLLVLSVT